ncbi:MAG: LamG domain-containing protein [Thermoguttaceae bacterium]|nr:LamG domain-containing protein [Thermoguttaceae bacterium]
MAPTARADLWPVLEAHWKLDETDTGSTLVHDARGGVPGTRMGNVGIGVPGVSGTAYSFPGQDSAYIDFNRADMIPQTGPFKLDMWIKTAVSAGRTQYLLSSYQGTDPGRTLLYMDSSGRIRLQIGGGSGFLLDTPSGTNFADDEWHQITLTREKVDPTTDILRLYIDEIERDSGVASPNLIIGGGNNHDWQLSGSINVNSRHFNGLIDDIRVYVPEPSSMVLLLLAAGVLLIRRGRA